MKINCPKCRKPFQLSSRRLSGQVVKIRCSSCGTVFKVRGKPRPDSTPKPDMAAASAEQAPVGAAKPAPQVPAIAWFAVVGKKRVGPFGEGALKRLISVGKVLPSTHLWRKGLDAWSPAEEIEELKDVFPAVPETVFPAVPETEATLTPTGVGAAAPPTEKIAPKAPPPSLPPKLPPKKAPPKPELKLVEEEASSAAVPEMPEQTDEGLAGWRDDDSTLEQDEETAVGFFEAGEKADQQHRSMEAIDFGEAEIEPISLEEAGVAKGARETLADFSVMARLSSRDRRRNTAILIVLGVILVGSLSSLIVFADPFQVFNPTKQQTLTREESEETLSIFAAESEARNKPLLNSAHSKVDRGSLEVDPLAGEEEWGTLDDSDLAALKARLLTAGSATDIAIDREHLRKSFEKNGKTSTGGRRKTPEKKDEMTDWGDGGSRVTGSDSGGTDLSSLVAHHKESKTRIPTLDGVAITARSKVVDKVETAGGGFLGSGSIEEGRVEADVKERKSSGKLWKLRAKTNVMRKVKAQTKKIKQCADMAEVDSGVKIFLHVGLTGRVTSISSPKGGSRFTTCLMDLFSNFRVVKRRLEKRIKMPVILRFE